MSNNNERIEDMREHLKIYERLLRDFQAKITYLESVNLNLEYKLKHMSRTPAESISGELEQHEAVLHEKEEIIRGYERSLEKMRERLAILESERADHMRSLSHLPAPVEVIIEELERHETAISEKEEIIRGYERSLGETRERLRILESENLALSRSLSHYTAPVEEIVGELEQHEAAISEKEEVIREYERSLEQMKGKVDALGLEKRYIERQLLRLPAPVELVVQELEQNKIILREKEGIISVAQEVLEEAEGLIKKKNEALGELKQKLEEEEKEKEHLRKEWEMVIRDVRRPWWQRILTSISVRSG